jgi:hypothetical protein
LTKDYELRLYRSYYADLDLPCSETIA